MAKKEKKKRQPLTAKQKKYITIGAITSVIIIILAFVLTSGYLPDIFNLDDTYDGAMMTKVRANITVAGIQYSTYEAPDGEYSDTTVYRQGQFYASIEILGGVDENNQPTNEPLLWNITNPDLLANALKRTTGQVGNSSSNPFENRQGFGEGGESLGNTFMDTNDTLFPGTQLFWDEEKGRNYWSRGIGDGILPDADEIRPFGYIEDAIWKAKVEWACATPVVETTFTFTDPVSGEALFDTTINIPVAVPLPFDPDITFKNHGTVTETVTIVLITPFKFLAEQMCSVSAKGSSINCTIVKGMPREVSDTKLPAAYLIPLIWGVVITAFLLVPLPPIQAVGLLVFATVLTVLAVVVVALQWWDSGTLGIEHDIDHDCIDMDDPVLLGEKVWIYGEERDGSSIFAGTYGGSDPDWGGSIYERW